MNQMTKTYKFEKSPNVDGPNAGSSKKPSNVDVVNLVMFILIALLNLSSLLNVIVKYFLLSLK